MICREGLWDQSPEPVFAESGEIQRFQAVLSRIVRTSSVTGKDGPPARPEKPDVSVPNILQIPTECNPFFQITPDVFPDAPRRKNTGHRGLPPGAGGNGFVQSHMARVLPAPAALSRSSPAAQRVLGLVAGRLRLPGSGTGAFLPPRGSGFALTVRWWSREPGLGVQTIGRRLLRQTGSCRPGESGIGVQAIGRRLLRQAG